MCIRDSPRTREQLYKGTPNMEAFKYALENSKNPVCYNGDINTVENYHRIIEKINNDSEMKIGSIMIGRGPVSYTHLADSSIILEMRMWVKTEDYWNAKFYLNENVKYKFDENNISIPFNQLDVNLKNVQ